MNKKVQKGEYGYRSALRKGADHQGGHRCGGDLIAACCENAD